MNRIVMRDPSRLLAPILGSLLAASCSSGGDPSVPAFDYGDAPLLLRVGESVELRATDAVGQGFVVTPPLPSGLLLDPATGAIGGAATVDVPAADYEIRGTLGGNAVEARIRIAVGAALPAEVEELEAGFAIERFATLTAAPGKFAIAPDGRVFVAERQSGVVRLLDASGAMQTTPFATLTVTTGSHQGLLGIVLSPSFASDGLLFAFATLPAGSGKPERSALYRFRDQNGLGVEPVVLVDDLPVATINNGGAMCFDGEGMLLLSVGDAEDPSAAQSDASMAGKLLRLDPSNGSVPADNPRTGDPIYAKGLRNAWAMAREPVAGAVFAADNGPASDDELLLVQPGRNFEWGAQPNEEFGANAGVQLRLWPDVIVPTGLAFADVERFSSWPESHQNSLFLSFYEEESVQRFELSGSLRTDIDREIAFLQMVEDGIANKPVDVQMGPEGKLWLLTFDAIYCVDRIR
ncbi:MAG: sorbosone dehydrogenase family protein [Planctomycetota bacterium]